MNREAKRLQEAKEGKAPWKPWGPYLSERQWGTVREDDREGGDAWNFFTHDHARSRAYRWGEDGIAVISDAIESNTGIHGTGPGANHQTGWTGLVAKLIQFYIDGLLNPKQAPDAGRMAGVSGRAGPPPGSRGVCAAGPGED